MKKVAKFEKISFNQFKQDFQQLFGDAENIQQIYDAIKLPKRATRFSAGYDFFTPVAITLKPNQTITIPTGVRCQIEDAYFLQLFPRSSLGFKFRLQLNNTVGIIDADYYNAENEGHIMIKMTNATNEDKTVELLAGHAVAQGIFTEFGITIDDDVTTSRTGGFGSTDKN